MKHMFLGPRKGAVPGRTWAIMKDCVVKNTHCVMTFGGHSLQYACALPRQLRREANNFIFGADIRASNIAGGVIAE
jgi:hypothetical protein